VIRTLLAAALLTATADAAAADGAAIFDANCAFCHQAGGVGVPGQFPRLAGRAGAIAGSPGGKKFLPEVLLNGMSGRVMVDGEQILGIMPAFNSLSDNDVAAVLTYISSLDHASVSYSSKEIKAARAQPKLSPSGVVAERMRLAAGKIVP
jgi:mono/diheme cytochrome c family protein